jgi:arginase
VQDAGNIHVRLPEELHYGDRRAKYLKEIAETSQEVAHRVYQTLEAGYFPLSLGGDHSVAVGTQAGVSKFYRDRQQPIGCLWINAHADMNTPESSPSGNVHGMPLAASLGHGSESLTNIFGYAPKIPSHQCVLIGARSLDSREQLHVKESGINVFTMREIDELGMRSVMEKSIALASNGTAGFVVSFDADVVDPGEAPGVGTPVPGGITYREAHLAMEMVADCGKMLAFELGEINPILDVMNKTAVLGVGLISSALGKKIL